MVVDAGGAVQTLYRRNLVCTDVLDLLLVLLGHYIPVPLCQAQLFLVVLRQLFLVLHFVLIHPAELMSAGLFAIKICNEAIDALLGVGGAVFALILMNHILASHHIAECVHLQLGIFELFQELPLSHLTTL